MIFYNVATVFIRSFEDADENVRLNDRQARFA